MTGIAQQDDQEMVVGFPRGLGSARLQQNTSHSCLSLNTQLKRPPPRSIS